MTSIPYVIMDTGRGFKPSFDIGGRDTSVSEGFANSLGYKIVKEGIISDLNEYNQVLAIVERANKTGKLESRCL